MLPFVMCKDFPPPRHRESDIIWRGRKRIITDAIVAPFLLSSICLFIPRQWYFFLYFFLCFRFLYLFYFPHPKKLLKSRNHWLQNDCEGFLVVGVSFSPKIVSIIHAMSFLSSILSWEKQKKYKIFQKIIILILERKCNTKKCLVFVWSQWCTF